MKKDPITFLYILSFDNYFMAVWSDLDDLLD